MKKFFVLISVITLSSCGAIGIGSNHKTMIYNNSDDVITVTSDSGMYKVQPNNSMNIYSKESISIQNKNKNCSQVNVVRELNSGAVFLDIVPGILFGIVPIFVDAVTNNLYKMPESYSYSCAG
jgi:hypothetical protein